MNALLRYAIKQWSALGNKARMEKTTPAQRTAIARKAAIARWDKAAANSLTLACRARPQ